METLSTGWKDSSRYTVNRVQEDNINTACTMTQITLPLGWKMNAQYKSGTEDHGPSDGVQHELDNGGTGDHALTDESETRNGSSGTVDIANSVKGVNGKKEKSQEGENVPKGWKESEQKNITFKFKKKGKLNDKEVVEIRKTHKSLFGWLGRGGKSTNTADVEPMEWEDKEREQKLERVRIKKLEWATTAAMRKFALEVINNAVEKVESKHCERIVMEAVEGAWEEIQVHRILKMLGETERRVQERVERSLTASRRDEAYMVEMVLKEEAREERIKLAGMKSINSRKKFEATKWRNMLQLLRSLNMGDYGMETEEVEAMIVELMEVEEHKYNNDEILMEEFVELFGPSEDSEDMEHNNVNVIGDTLGVKAKVNIQNTNNISLGMINTTMDQEWSRKRKGERLSSEQVKRVRMGDYQR